MATPVMDAELSNYHTIYTMHVMHNDDCWNWQTTWSNCLFTCIVNTSGVTNVRYFPSHQTCTNTTSLWCCQYPLPFKNVLYVQCFKFSCMYLELDICISYIWNCHSEIWYAYIVYNLLVTITHVSSVYLCLNLPRQHWIFDHNTFEKV